MIPGKRTLTIYQGMTFFHQVNFETGPVNAPTPRDMSGFTWASQARSRDDAADIALSFTVDDSDAASGVIRLTATAEETGALVGDKNLVWDLRSTDGTNVYYWLFDKVIVIGNVTRV
jgi:hypothetical protein